MCAMCGIDKCGVGKPLPVKTEQVAIRKIGQLRAMIPVEHNGVIRLVPLGDDGILHVTDKDLERITSGLEG